MSDSRFMGLFALGALMAALSACVSGDRATGDGRALGSPEAEVSRLLDDLHDAASKADGARYFGHFAPNAVFIGTDASERWTLDEFREYARPHFEAGRGWSYVATQRHVELARGGDLAWFDEQLTNEKYGQLRGSGVWSRRGGSWRLEQYVLSFAIPNELASR